MGKRKRKAYFFLALIFAAVCASALVVSCGGGGGGGGGAAPTATLTAANSGAATSAVSQALSLLGPSMSSADLAPVSVSPGGPMNVIVDRMKAMSATLRDGPTAQGTMHDSGPCFDSGSITLDASWTDDQNAYKRMRDLQMTITASNCVESPYTMNGTLTMTFSGTLDAPTGYTLSANARFADASYPFDITMSGFSMAMTNIAYSGSMVTGATATFNGSVTGNVDAETVNEGFQNFRMVFSDTAAGFSYSLSGGMRASCLGSGWVTVSTPTPISGPSTALCPTGGEVVMKAGGDTVNAVIYPDYSIEVSFNGTIAHTYNNCDELTGVCAAI